MKITPNPTFLAELKKTAQWRQFTMAAAQRAATIGREHASDGFMGPASQLQARMGPDGGQIVHDSPGWHLEEFGTPHTLPRAPLRKGVEGAGMKFQGR